MRNKVLFIAMLLLALVLALPAVAQQPTVFCGSLAAADCELLKANADAQMNLNSAAFALTGELNITGLPDTPDMNFTLDGKGGFNVDREALNAVMSSMMGGGKPDVKASVQALLTLLKGLDVELTFNVGIPEALAKQGGLPVNTITLDAKFVDGIGYLNFDELDKVAGGMLAQQGMKGWVGLNIAELGDKLLEENAAMLEQMGAMAGTSTMMMNPADYEFVYKYVEIARTDSGSGDAEFTMGLDFAGMFADPQFLELMKQQMAAQGNTMTDAQIQQLGPMMAMMTQGLTFQAVQRVNTDSKLTTHTGIDVKFDMTSLMALSGQKSSGSSIVTLTLNMDYSGHNATTVSAPAGAQVIPTESIRQMMSGGSR
jgi:hypothetical protein